MKKRNHHLHAIARAAALSLLACGVHAQETTLKPVTVTGQAFPPAADVTGFGDLPLKDVPVSASVIDSRQIEQTGARRLADLMRFDPSLTDAYDAPGYWDSVSIRGYTLDNDYNFRREGLPINAETPIPLENKERVEILRGTSGIQSGVSAPGGLVNYVVKRPTDADTRSVRFEFTQRASLLGAVDLGGRFGNDGAFGYRINAAEERLRPMINNLDGHRSLFSLAGDWRLPNGGLFEGEFEWSNKLQPSQVGYSLLGNTLPAVPDPRRNLNNQPWTPPTRFDALTGTIRYSQPLAGDWRVSLQAGTQHLTNDDYTAFPFGCSKEGNFDRYCSDGTFDYYDYRSPGEKRRQIAEQAELKGTLDTADVHHDISFGVLHAVLHETTRDYAYNFVGEGNIDGTAVVPPDPTPIAGSAVNRDERSIELSARDAIHWTDRLTTWLGVRNTKLDRVSIEEADSPGYRQSITTPWVAVSYKLTPEAMLYASWGEGVESAVVPGNVAVYSNAGAVLPALKSRQKEIGAKGGAGGWSWQVDAFDIRRPITNLDACTSDASTGLCTGALDGVDRHRGVEAAVSWSGTAWRAGVTAMLLRARREGSVETPELNGLRPTNVPSFVSRAFVGWKVPGVQGLEAQGWLVHEGNRAVLADNSIMLPSWTRLDAALRYERAVGKVATTWTLGVDNLTNKRYWRESPFEFSHVYLYPGAPRTLRFSVTAAM